VNICDLILTILKDERGACEGLKASEIIKRTGFSRAYVNRFFRELRTEGKIVLFGKANKARYVLATPKTLKRTKKSIRSVTRLLHNKDLSEDIVLNEIKKNTGIFIEISENVSDILNYAFSEMLNNAIEHSLSKTIKITMQKGKTNISFNIVDRGIGIFNNIMKKKNLRSTMEAIQDLLKGKQSTMPEAHSGEGIFFTSKAAGKLIIQSSDKKLIFNNLMKDIFIKDVKNTVGTKVSFLIGANSKKQLSSVFKQYTDNSFEFSGTKVTVKLYGSGAEYISRSQARRILSGLDKFKTVILDFKEVRTIGQGFADEIFRVWKSRHPEVSIYNRNMNENTNFMVKRAEYRP